VLWAEQLKFNFQQGHRRDFFPLPQSPETVFYPVGIRVFPGIKSSEGMKLTTHLLIWPRLRMHEAIPPTPKDNFMAWCKQWIHLYGMELS
jgi:hypothetical protein